jgi:hypothetical protein
MKHIEREVQIGVGPRKMVTRAHNGGSVQGGAAAVRMRDGEGETVRVRMRTRMKGGWWWWVASAGKEDQLVKAQVVMRDSSKGDTGRGTVRQEERRDRKNGRQEEGRRLRKVRAATWVMKHGP